MQHKRASSIDVAKEAGVSQSTVSRVFNGSGIKVSPETRERILAAADKLGYHPSLIARSLNAQSTRIIGIVMKRFDSSYYMSALNYFTQMFQKAGYSVMIFNFSNDEDVENNLKRALEYQVAGMIISSASLSSPLAYGFKRLGIPLFLFNRLSEETDVNTICCDNYGGGESVAEYLIERGHKHLLYISGVETTSTNRDREMGFINALREHGITDIPIISADYYWNSGFKAAEEIVKSNIKCDGIFCASDYIAMGVYDYFRFNTTIRIPEDLSVVGFDGAPYDNTIAYPLTTVQQPLKRMVEKTVELMIQKIENKSTEIVHHLYPTKILERGSVADRN